MAKPYAKSVHGDTVAILVTKGGTRKDERRSMHYTRVKIHCCSGSATFHASSAVDCVLPADSIWCPVKARVCMSNLSNEQFSVR